MYIDTGLRDRNGMPIHTGNQVKLILDNGEERIFDVCFRTAERIIIKTLPGFEPEETEVSITGIFFHWQGHYMLPCVDKNGVSDVNKMEVIQPPVRALESLCQANFSELDFPLVTIYEKPFDFPNDFVARVWDGKGAKPTNTIIIRSDLREIREDIRAAGFTTVFNRAEDDDPHIVETWM